jgi:hypothetical protein
VLPRGATLGATIDVCSELVLVNLRHTLSTVALNVAGKVLVVSVLMVITSAVGGVIGGAQQKSAQRGIDAHTIRVTATYTDFIPARRKYDEDTYVLSYFFEGQVYQAWLPSLPGHHEIGDELCAEIDETQREHARICGTHGGYDGAATRLALLVGLLVFVAAVIVAAARVPVTPEKTGDKPRHTIGPVDRHSGARSDAQRRR